MPTECNPCLFGFAPVGRREVVGSFDGGAITSDAGALLLRQTDRIIGLTQRLAACFYDLRSQELIEHSVETLVGQRVFGNALGDEDLNDHDELRHDPTQAVLAGKLAARRANCAPVAGKSTLNRLELSGAEVASMAYVLVNSMRRLALQTTDLADATCGTIRRKLFKIGALVTISVRRIKFAMASGCPYKAVFATAWRSLCDSTT